MHFANTTIDTNVVDEVLRFSLRERITCEILVVGNCQSLDEKCSGQRSSVIFSGKSKVKGHFLS